MITEAGAIESLLKRFCQSIKDQDMETRDAVDRAIISSKLLTRAEKTNLQGLVSFGAME